jgi:phosphoesterase RecJ-like protein
MQKYDPALHDKLFNEVDVIICLDFNRANRLAKMQNAFMNSKKLKVCIDHHQDSEKFADHFFVDQDYSATGHIIYDLIKKTSIVKLDYNIAYQIYAAIMTDTGSFRFERTTPEIHRIIAELLELNVDPSEIFDEIYDHSKISKIKLLGKALDSLTLYGNGNKIGYMTLRRKEFEETGAIESDTDGFVNFSLSVEGVCLGILFIELKEGFKVSFRSKGAIPVNKLAAEFGGGGHTNASGVRFFSENLDEFVDKILSRAEKYLA